MIDLTRELNSNDFDKSEIELMIEESIIHKKMHVLKVIQIKNKVTSLLLNKNLKKYNIQALQIISDETSINYTLIGKNGEIKPSEIINKIFNPNNNNFIHTETLVNEPHSLFNPIFNSLTWVNKGFLDDRIKNSNVFVDKKIDLKFDEHLPENLFSLLLSEELKKSIIYSQLMLEVPKKGKEKKSKIKI